MILNYTIHIIDAQSEATKRLQELVNSFNVQEREEVVDSTPSSKICLKTTIFPEAGDILSANN